MYQTLGPQADKTWIFEPYGHNAVPRGGVEGKVNLADLLTHMRTELDSDGNAMPMEHIARTFTRNFALQSALGGNLWADTDKLHEGLINQDKLNDPSQSTRQQVSATSHVFTGSASDYAKTPSNAFEISLRDFVMPNVRGQDLGPGLSTRWEYETGGASPNNVFFNYALFPAVFNWSEGSKDARISRGVMLPYMVCYSSFQPIVHKDPTKGLLPFNPTFKAFKLSDNRRDVTQVLATGDVSGGNTVYIDTTLIGDTNCAASIVSALENSFCANNAYIYMMPVIPAAAFDSAVNGIPAFENTHRYRVNGASLGMAVFAAVSGWAPNYYTGYIKYIVPGQVIVNQYASKIQMQQMYGTTRTTYQPPPIYPTYQSGTQVKDTVGDFPGLVKVPAQLNFVETVDAMILKIAFCSNVAAAFVFPAKTAFGDSMATYINNAENKAQSIAWLNFLPDIYTMSMAQDGIPMVRKLSGNVFGLYSNMMASTVTEMETLQSIHAIVSKMTKARNNISASTWAHVATGVSARFDLQAQHSSEARERAKAWKNKTKDMTPEQKHKAILDRRSASATKTETQRKVKKAKSALAGDARTKVRDSIAQMLGKARDNVEQVKYSSAYQNATKSGRKGMLQAVNAEYTKIKRQFSKKNIVNNIVKEIQPVAATRDPQALQRALWESLYKALINAGLSPETAKNVTDQRFKTFAAKRDAPKGSSAIPTSVQTASMIGSRPMVEARQTLEDRPMLEARPSGALMNTPPEEDDEEQFIPYTEGEDEDFEDVEDLPAQQLRIEGRPRGRFLKQFQRAKRVKQVKSGLAKASPSARIKSAGEIAEELAKRRKEFEQKKQSLKAAEQSRRQDVAPGASATGLFKSIGGAIDDIGDFF